jgi:hypothetical protein
MVPILPEADSEYTGRFGFLAYAGHHGDLLLFLWYSVRMVEVQHHNDETPNVPSLWGRLHGFMKGVASSVGKLFAEDPKVGEATPPAFLKEFAAEHARMIRERQQGLAGAGIMETMRVHGWEYPYAVFDVVFRSYQSRFNGLSNRQMVQVRSKLMEACGLGIPSIG